MKKILGLTVAALMVIGLIGGGTWAYFSDIGVVESNTIAAGTLYFKDTAMAKIELSNLKPVAAIANAESAAAWALKNEGSIDGKLTKVSFSSINATDGTPAAITDKIGAGDPAAQLQNYLKVAAWIDINGDGNLDEGDIILLSDGTIYTWTGEDEPNEDIKNVTTVGDPAKDVWALLSAYGSEDWTVSVDLPKDEGGDVTFRLWQCFEHDATTLGGDGPYAAMYLQNRAQGDSVEWDVTFVLEQS